MAHIQDFLSRDTDATSQESPEVLFYIRALPLLRKEITPSQRLEFDRRGVAIWNAACKLSTKSESLDNLAHLAKGMLMEGLLPWSDHLLQSARYPTFFSRVQQAPGVKVLGTPSLHPEIRLIRHRRIQASQMRTESGKRLFG